MPTGLGANAGGVSLLGSFQIQVLTNMSLTNPDVQLFAGSGRSWGFRPLPRAAQKEDPSGMDTGNGIHRNPVYGGYFADPFVWKSDGVYFAVGTGEFEARGRTVGRIFPLLQSNDFVHWHFARSAMMRPDYSLGTNFWAPAVAAHKGRFYLFYSVGFEDKHHRLRVSCSYKPTGPYEDCGVDLLDPAETPFAIDPHPFQDSDGQWYLFFACDFLDETSPYRAGTGLAAVRLKSMTEVDGPPVTILRARSDWQRFQSNRSLYDRTWDWHTVEGPCVVKHGSQYICFFSGGRWETESYGVDYGVSTSVLGPYSDEGNETGPRVLKSIPGALLGPGHNSVIQGPEGAADYMVYHAWDVEKRARRMFIDRVLWTAGGPVVQPSLAGEPATPVQRSGAYVLAQSGRP